MIDKRSWEEFRNTGLTLIINQILQVFGWSIAYDIATDDDGNTEIVSCYPVRTKFRGFTDDAVSEAYTNVTRWMKDNIDVLLEEVKEKMETKTVRCNFVLYYNSSGKCVAIGINGMFHSVQSKSEAMDILNREIDDQEKEK